MGKTSKETAPRVEEMEGYEGRFTEIDDYTIVYETYTADADLTPFFKGLPDDQCQSPHWGHVTKGKVIYHLGDGTTEEIGAGEAYYVGPGHTPEITAGTELIEFSPTDELNATMEVVMRNVEAAEG